MCARALARALRSLNISFGRRPTRLPTSARDRSLSLPFCGFLGAHYLLSKGGNRCPLLSSGKERGGDIISPAGDMFVPMAALRLLRCVSNASHSSSVCCAVSVSAPQWWHVAVASAPIRFRYSPKHPCPVSIWVILYVSSMGPDSAHCSQLGRMALATLLLSAPVRASSCFHLRHAQRRTRCFASCACSAIVTGCWPCPAFSRVRQYTFP